MARADLLVSLVRAAVEGDRSMLTRAVEALIAEERAKDHHRLAEELDDALRSERGRVAPAASGYAADLVHEVSPQRKLNDLVLAPHTEHTLSQLVEEQHRADVLRTYGLEPRHRVLLVGAPGNGKTSVAECLAGELFVPLYVVRYEGIIASFLGETTTRLQALFDYVRTRHCVLFFDEFDTVGKERGDEHETGEIKRVVSSLLLQIDHLPSQVVVVAATNHAELLDRAVWRRFQLRLDLPAPTRDQVEGFLAHFSERHRLDLGRKPRTLADHLLGASFAEVEDFATTLLRQYVLNLPDADMGAITAAELRAWSRRVEARGGA